MPFVLDESVEMNQRGRYCKRGNGGNVARGSAVENLWVIGLTTFAADLAEQAVTGSVWLREDDTNMRVEWAHNGDGLAGFDAHSWSDIPAESSIHPLGRRFLYWSIHDLPYSGYGN